MNRRAALSRMAGLLAVASIPRRGFATPAQASVIRLNLPGPRSLPFLPLELISPLGIDRELGVALKRRYFTSGVLAFEDMMAGNASFAGHGFAILPSMRKMGKPAVAIAQVAGSAAALALLVRADLAQQIKQVSDLKFHSIGTASGSINSKTYMQMLGERILNKHGVKANEVRWVQTAQHWDSVRGVLLSRSADAVLCEEPFASRAVAAGLARFLFSSADMAQSDPRMLGGHLRAVISMSQKQPAAANEAHPLVHMLQRSLAWMADAKPEEIASKLDFENAQQRNELADVLHRYPDIFSRDGRFNSAEIVETASQLKSLGSIKDASELEQMIDRRWTEPAT